MAADAATAGVEMLVGVAPGDQPGAGGASDGLAQAVARSKTTGTAQARWFRRRRISMGAIFSVEAAAQSPVEARLIEQRHDSVNEADVGERRPPARNTGWR